MTRVDMKNRSIYMKDINYEIQRFNKNKIN
jgi:hypothetical protein